MKTYTSMKSLIYILALVLPLLFVSSTHELYEFPKTTFLYLFTALILLVLVGRVLTNIHKLPKVSLRLPPLVIMLMLGTFIISVALSEHLDTSVWGYYTRFSGGLVSFTCFILIYTVCINIFEKEDLHKILDVLFVTAIPIGAYSIVQHFSGVERAYSTFGQANWLAQYLGIVCVLAVFSFTEGVCVLVAGIAHNSIEGVKSIKTRSIFLFVVAVSSFAGLWFTFSLSGIAGFIVALFVYIGYSFFTFKSSKSLGLLVLPLSILLFCFALVVVFFPGLFWLRIQDALVDLPFKDSNKHLQQSFSQSPAILQQPTSQASATYNPGNYQLSDPGYIRRGIWEGSLNLIMSSPKVFILGTGPQTFPYVFQNFRPAYLNYSSEWDFVLNRPHNYYLELLAERGAVGFILYLVLVVAIFLRSPASLRLGLIVYLVSNFFGWPSVSTELLFWVFAAFAYLRNPNYKILTIPFSSRRFAVILCILCTIFGLGFVYKVSLIYVADVYAEQSGVLVSRGNTVAALKSISRALKLNPNEPSYYRERAKVFLVMMAEQGDAVNFKPHVLADLKAAQKLNPSNLVVLRNSVALYYLLSFKDLSKPIQNNVDSKYLEEAQNFMKNLKTRYPTDLGVLALVAEYEKKLGLLDDFNQTRADAQELRPDIVTWHEGFN